jgi:hypothetical protein
MIRSTKIYAYNPENDEFEFDSYVIEGSLFNKLKDWWSNWWFWHRNKTLSYYIWYLRNFIMIRYNSYQSNPVRLAKKYKDVWNISSKK